MDSALHWFTTFEALGGPSSAWPLLLALGVFAGALTTFAGLGGGMVLTAALSNLWGTHFALAATAPALLVGNAHRFWRFRAALDPELARRTILGGAPGALVGGTIAVALPEHTLRFVFFALVTAVLLRSIGAVQVRVPQGAVGPGAFLAGVLTSTSSGGALITAPMLLATGLHGPAYIATSALGAVVIHLVRLCAYGAGQGFNGEAFQVALVLILGLPVGNRLGEALRERVGTEHTARIEVGAAVVAGALML